MTDHSRFPLSNAPGVQLPTLHEAAESCLGLVRMLLNLEGDESIVHRIFGHLEDVVESVPPTTATLDEIGYLRNRVRSSHAYYRQGEVGASVYQLREIGLRMRRRADQ